MSDPAHQSIDLGAAIYEDMATRMYRMGMGQDLEAGTGMLARASEAESISEGVRHEFSAGALRHVVQRLQAENLEGDPRAWDRAADLLAEAQALVEGARTALAHHVGGC